MGESHPGFGKPPGLARRAPGSLLSNIAFASFSRHSGEESIEQVQGWRAHGVPPSHGVAEHVDRSHVGGEFDDAKL